MNACSIAHGTIFENTPAEQHPRPQVLFGVYTKIADKDVDNIDTMLKAAGIEAEPYWGMLYGGLFKKTPLTEILATKQGGYVGPE